ncbi:MAG: DNA helicase RecQ [Candidatus Levybacteria bacterium]|nr:DNA helicase RecQ [Candidatus Levybacteria bacterium]
MDTVQQTLQQYFGYDTFRPLQGEIIQDVLDQKHVFVLMPTGGGKSLCYQLPSVVMNGTTIVISPLISLMKDQVDALNLNGIKAAYLNSSLTASEQRDVLSRLESGKISLLYVAPERLAQPGFIDKLKELDINFFAIDEAHCISQWGHDFRPEYRQLKTLRKHFPDKSIIALTATATPRVKSDIIKELQIHDAKTYQASFVRPNLSYKIIPKQKPFDQTLAYIKSRTIGEAGIIYCQSRKKVASVAERLEAEGIRALPYHAGLPDQTRQKNQERFLREDVDVIVATVAFGMGINKSNVRYVIHYDLPQSLEHYYQETGRAGRDGLPSECLFLYSIADKYSYERFILEKQSEEEQLIAKAQLQRVVDYATSRICRRNLLLQYFAEETKETKCASCDNCLSPQETIDGTVLAQKILSCVYRVKERFGLAHIAGILTGSQQQKIIQYQHDKLSTYGIITDYSAQDVKMFIYELLQLGYLQQSKDQYGLLALTAKSKALLLGQETIVLTKPMIQKTVAKEKRDSYDDYNMNSQLFNRLRSIRKKLADEKNVPPYLIFSDATLKEMATAIPLNLNQFAQIKGVGAQKLEQYGEIFTSAIKAFAASAV